MGEPTRRKMRRRKKKKKREMTRRRKKLKIEEQWKGKEREIEDVPQQGSKHLEED
jgi:hypothetical protein